MSEITFIYKGNKISIQCSKGEKMKDIIERLSNKINISKDDIYGLYNGKILDEELKEEQIEKDENNKKIILIYEYNKSTIINNIIKSNEKISLNSGENCLIKINDNKIKIQTKNEILIKYLIKKNAQKINIFGEEFVRYNKDKCKYIYENKEYELTKEFDLTNFDKSNEILEIKLTDINNITNMSYLFCFCYSLIEVPDISEWDTSNIVNMESLFSHCELLKSLHHCLIYQNGIHLKLRI